ncbi:phytoene desaturase [Candidatus Woesearchaeota archaeon]|nr:phytoene desaturase [Candidatus Woesearchaeota archaeon]
MKIIIIGSGFGGLSAAALLAKQGHEVTVFEKNEQVGGRASMFVEKKFRFDAGPSWYLMPDVFEKFYAELGTSPNKELNLKLLNPSYKIFFHDSELEVTPNIEETYALFESLEKGSAEKLKKYLERAKYQYDTAMREFIYREYNKLSDFFSFKLLVQGTKLNVFQNLDKYVSNNFESDKIKKILEYTMVFLGGAPKNTPALYSIMSHIDFNMGVFYPEGGLNAVALSIYDISKKLGVKYKLNEPVQRLVVDKGVIKKVVTNVDSYSADLVISNADYWFTENYLLDEKYRSYSKKYWSNRVVAPSAFIMYLGINKKIRGLEHHNLFLENDWMHHFNQLFKEKKWPDAPSYYVCCPSKTDKSVAPKDKENLFVLVPVAPGLRDSEEIRNMYKDKILMHLEETLKTKIIKHIDVIKIFSHSDFKSRYNSFKGSALGLSHTLFQTAIFRPSMKSKKVKNLFYTGHYNHPGIGVPMVIISSQILANKIKNEYKK